MFPFRLPSSYFLPTSSPPHSQTASERLLSAFLRPPAAHFYLQQHDGKKAKTRARAIGACLYVFVLLTRPPPVGG